MQYEKRMERACVQQAAAARVGLAEGGRGLRFTRQRGGEGDGFGWVGLGRIVA